MVQRKARYVWYGDSHALEVDEEMAGLTLVMLRIHRCLRCFLGKLDLG